MKTVRKNFPDANPQAGGQQTPGREKEQDQTRKASDPNKADPTRPEQTEPWKNDPTRKEQRPESPTAPGKQNKEQQMSGNRNQESYKK